MSRIGTVIVYHGVGPCPESSDPANMFMPVDRFEWQMDYLARRKTVVPLEAIVRGTAPRNAVAVTFDDAFRGVLTHAAPVLRRHGFPATVFVPATWLGETSETWYDAPGCDCHVMSAEELREAEAQGLEIGSHGSAHLDLGSADPSDVEADIHTSVERLTEVLGHAPRYLAYPYGRHSEAARRAAAARFEAAFAIDEPHAGLYAFERVGITRLDSRPVFALKASGRYVRWRRSRLGSGLYSLVRPVSPRTRRHRSAER